MLASNIVEDLLGFLHRERPGSLSKHVADDPEIRQDIVDSLTAIVQRHLDDHEDHLLALRRDHG